VLGNVDFLAAPVCQAHIGDFEVGDCGCCDGCCHENLLTSIHRDMLICIRIPMTPSILKTLRVVADPNRLRILLLLRSEELSVAELQEILVMGQSTISTHLSQLKNAGLVEDRRTGKNSLYRISPADGGDPA